MNLDILYNNIKKNAKGSEFLLSDESLGLEDKIWECFLESHFGCVQLAIQSFRHTFDGKQINLFGQAALGECPAEINILFCEVKSRLCAKFTSKMKSAYMQIDRNQKIKANDVSKSYEFFLVLPYIDDTGQRGKLAEPIKLPDLVGLLLGEYMDFTFLPDIPMQAIELAYEEKHLNKIPSRYAQINSTTKLDIYKNLSVGGLGAETLQTEKNFDFAIFGKITIGTVDIPLVMRYANEGFFLGLDICDGGLELPSINDIAGLVGINVSGALPESFSEIGKPKLQKFTAKLPGSLTSVENVSFEAVTSREWEFFGIKGLTLSDIYIGFDIGFGQAGTEISGQIQGTVNIGSFCVTLFAQKKAGAQGGYVLGGKMPSGKDINLKKAINEFGKMLEIGNVLLPEQVPVVLLRGMQMSFDTDSKCFTCAATIMIEPDDGQKSPVDKLFNINAQFDIKSELTGSKRTYSVLIKGVLEVAGQHLEVSYAIDSLGGDIISAEWNCEGNGSPISLGALFKAFGADHMPDEIRDLDISIDSVKIECAISKKSLAFEVNSIKYGKLEFSLSVDQQNKTQYFFSVECAKAIGLSKLPVVGEGLGLLGDVRIEKIGVVASSKDIQEKNIIAGVSLSGTIAMLSETNDFKLQIVTKQQEKFANAAEQSGVTKWFVIEKGVGIFELHKLGVTYRDGYAGLLLDASLTANPVKIDFMELGMGIKLSDPADMTFFLSGLGVGFKNPTLEINGAFLKSEDSYDGKLLIKAKAFSLFAVGSYADNSIFAYGVLDMPIGGPPAFFITGLAAGFGYNRDIIIPPVSEINKFPLVKGALDPSYSGEMIKDIKKHIKVAKGSSFAVAGIKFNSFKMIDSFALVSVAFDKELEINLLGLSEINVPTNLKAGTSPIAHAELALKATISPAKGVIAVVAELTSGSYVLSKDCRLTGGFAFYTWISGDHEGDFVITLGGYNRMYKKPDHYPSVPRLGFIWQPSSNLTFKGEVYFAITPTCVMAGGMISAVYQSGELKAWFEARLDVLISWKPFHYDISMYIGIGASYRAFMLFGYVTFKLELSVSLDIWGPDFTGKAKITWFIISFTVFFGANASDKKSYIEWDDFKKSFLPYKSEASGNGSNLVTATIHIAQGLCKDKTVDPENLVLNMSSAVPATSIVFCGQKIYERYDPDDTKTLGVLPMGESKFLDSNLIVKIQKSDGNEVDFDYDVSCMNVPNALWGTKEKVSEKNSLIKAATGIIARPHEQEAFKTLPENKFLDLHDLTVYEKIEKNFYYNKISVLKDPPQKESNIKEYASTVMRESTIRNRKAIIKDLKVFGFALEEDTGLGKMASLAEDILYEEIKLKTLVSA